jgi:type II secretory pathway pseudopilin PulG
MSTGVKIALGCAAMLAIGACSTLILVPVAIPSFLSGMHRGKQKRTIADLRVIGTAIESYAIDHQAYPVATNMAELESCIEPAYVRVAPTSDGWERTFLVSSTTGSYTIGSGGKDGGALTLVEGGGATRNFDDAIVFSNGRFVQWPESIPQ